MSLLLGLGVAAPVAADYWYEHYARAEKALDQQDWERAVSELNEALARKGDSGARSRSYGMNVVAYFPYLQLGRAYLELGQPELALQAFATERELEAIAEAPDHLAALERYEQRAREQQQEARAEQDRRRAALVEENLTEAQRLRRAGRFDEAIVAAGRAFALDSESVAAQNLMEELRAESAAAAVEQRRTAQSAELVDEARSHLDAGRPGEAARCLREARSLAASDEIDALLRQAEKALRLQLATQESAAAEAKAIDDALAQARQHFARGELEAASSALQPALALEPEHAAALELSRQISAARQRIATQSEISQWLEKAETELAAGRPSDAVVAANRVLYLAPGQADAVALLTRAYRQMGEELLGRAGGPRLPPAIRFADLRQQGADGGLVELVSRPEFLLTGVVIDRAPVTVEVADETGSARELETRSHRVGEVTLTEFTLRQRLAPGRTSFQVEAVGETGLTSGAEYAVLYSRPFLRSPWMWGILGGAAVLLTALLFVSRQLRLRRLRRRRYNPFIAGAPVLDEELFFGRERLIERVLETVHSNSLLLFGERRIGKTSLQHQLKKRLEALDDPVYRFYPVYIDLQGCPEARFFQTLADEIWEELGPLLQNMDPSPLLHSEERFGYRELVAELRRILKALREQTRKKVKIVLLIDEVDELNAYDPRINQRLRSLFMKSFAENLAAVVSGVEIRRQWEREGSPWYNFFEEVEVAALERRAVAELVRRPLAGIFRVDRGAVERIIELSGCKPYQVQRLCVALVNRLHDAGRRRLTVADVEAVAAEL